MKQWSTKIERDRQDRKCKRKSGNKWPRKGPLQKSGYRGRKRKITWREETGQNKLLPVFYYTLRLEYICGIAPCTFDFESGWRSVFTSPFYPRLGGLEGWFGHFGKDESFAFFVIRTPIAPSLDLRTKYRANPFLEGKWVKSGPRS